MNAKCKKFLTMLLLVCVSIGAAGCSAYSNQRYYERAQLMMGSGEYAEAAELFHQLGEYEDSAEYALYAAALDALQRGKIELARANLLEIAPFKSADRYLRYLDALDAENEGELDSALDIYVSLGSFEDCAERAQTLEAAIPEQAIRQGRQLMSQGDYEGRARPVPLAERLRAVPRTFGCLHGGDSAQGVLGGGGFAGRWRLSGRDERLRRHGRHAGRGAPGGGMPLTAAEAGRRSVSGGDAGNGGCAG